MMHGSPAQELVDLPRGTAEIGPTPSGTGARKGEKDSGYARLYRVFLTAAVVSFVGLTLWLGQGLTFFHDELLINQRQWTLDDLLRGANEHWATAFIAVWMAIRDTFGTTSYQPFLVALIAADLFMASGLYAVLRRVASPGYAAGGVVVFLFFGTGFENFFWAFQMDFAIAAGLGLWALAARDARLAAILLTIAVATQGVALFFLAAVVVRWLGRRDVLWLAIPIAVYGAWFVAFGLHALGPQDSPASLSNLLAFAIVGLGTAVGSVFTLPPLFGFGVLAALMGIGLRPPPSRWSFAALAGLGSMFLIVGLVRSHLGPEAAAASRYMYVALPFVLILGAVAVERVALPWRYVGPPLVVAAVLLNLHALLFARIVWQMYLDGRLPS